MKRFWWKCAVIAAVISVLSHVSAFAEPQIFNAPYPPLPSVTKAAQAPRTLKLSFGHSHSPLQRRQLLPGLNAHH